MFPLDFGLEDCVNFKIGPRIALRGSRLTTLIGCFPGSFAGFAVLILVGVVMMFVRAEIDFSGGWVLVGEFEDERVVGGDGGAFEFDCCFTFNVGVRSLLGSSLSMNDTTFLGWGVEVAVFGVLVMDAP